MSNSVCVVVDGMYFAIVDSDATAAETIRCDKASGQCLN